MSYIDRTRAILKYGGTIWYVDKVNGDNTNTGRRPDIAFETIGTAIAVLSSGDAISIAPGTYTEVGLDLNVNQCEMWFELGAILAPASGTPLTVSGNYCRVICREGALRVNPAAGATGVVVSGNFCYLAEIRVACGSSANIGFDITGDGCDLRKCRCSSPLTAAFKVQGDKTKLENCCTGGEVGDSSIGFWITNSCDKTRICGGCQSQGHETAGLQIDSGVTNAAIYGLSSGGGDGRWVNNGTLCVIEDMNYDGADEPYTTPVAKTITFAGAVTTYNIFQITGAVRIIDIEGIVTTVIPNTSSDLHLELYSTNGTVDITDAPGTDIDSYVVGAGLVRLGESTTAIVGANPDNTPAIAENTGKFSQKNVIDCFKDDAADTYIRAVISNALASGAIRWTCRWTPISADGFVEPA
jgi:hypothetical protein